MCSEQGRLEYGIINAGNDEIHEGHGQGIVASNDASYVSYTGFTGMLSYCYSNACKVKNIREWIVVTGATAHMCNDLSIFSKPQNSN